MQFELGRVRSTHGRWFSATGRPLSGVMLYLFAKEAKKKGSFKLRITEIYKTMSRFQSDFKDLGIPITFEKIGNDVYPRRIDEALYYLMPFDVQIVNPSQFSEPF